MVLMMELLFNWKGFISVMMVNVVFMYRNIYLKKVMVSVWGVMDMRMMCG